MDQSVPMKPSASTRDAGIDTGKGKGGQGKEKRDSTTSVWMWANFMACIVVGPINFVMYKVMYAAFGDSRAFFVSQGVNLLYVIFGGIILEFYSRRGEITPEMKQIPHTKFMIMGLLDSMGGFLAAMGANGTSGTLQQLLNQTLIPLTMLLSYLILGQRSTRLQIVASCLILLGAWIVISSSSGNDGPSSFSFISNLVYFSSNVPIAFSMVYKELGFRDMSVHVVYLTQWVSIYQLAIGQVLGVLQLIPGLGSPSGSSLSSINASFWSGLQCYVHMDDVCAGKHTFWLLTGYCLLNFLYNIVGLYLVKFESATLSNITAALVLPVTVLVFNLPVMGPYRESCDVYTVVGLVVVLVGFALWRMRTMRAVCAALRTVAVWFDGESAGDDVDDVEGEGKETAGDQRGGGGGGVDKMLVDGGDDENHAKRRGGGKRSTSGVRSDDSVTPYSCFSMSTCAGRGIFDDDDDDEDEDFEDYDDEEWEDSDEFSNEDNNRRGPSSSSSSAMAITTDTSRLTGGSREGDGDVGASAALLASYGTVAATDDDKDVNRASQSQSQSQNKKVEKQQGRRRGGVGRAVHRAPDAFYDRVVVLSVMPAPSTRKGSAGRRRRLAVRKMVVGTGDTGAGGAGGGGGGGGMV